MEARAKEASRLPVYALIAMLGAAGGFFYQGEPFRSARPSVEERHAALIDYHEIEARLWQDPFQAVADHLERMSDGDEHQVSINLDQFKSDQWDRLPGPGSAKPVLMLPVAMPGSFSANDCEDRRRIRYAVLSALELADFAPLERRKLRVVGFPRHEVEMPTTGGPLLLHDLPLRPNRSPAESRPDTRPNLIVPFEWFTKKAANETPTCYVEPAGAAGIREAQTDCYATVLVLWIDEETALGQEPARALSSLLRRLEPQGEADWRITVRYLGPGSSDALARLTEDLNKSEHLTWPRDASNPGLAGADRKQRAEPAASRPRSAFRAFSTWATTDPHLLGIRRERPDGETSAVETMVATDSELMAELVDELELRGVGLTARKSDDHVLLVSEWDTLYGRALPMTFAATIHLRRQQGRPHAPSRDEPTLHGSFEAIRSSENWPPNIHRVIYLRGLDGQIPGRAKPSPPPAASTRANRRDALESLERPEGPAQLDYVRRQAAALKQEQGERVRAIGILGSDVYDKLLLLQALRRLFPRAIFFTTDLDARMLHPSQTRWARNLVVASSYGLTLSPPDREHTDDCPFCRRQSRLAPFRESYQTGLHLAALRALETIPPGVDLATLRAPKVYEIGRTRARQLVPPETLQHKLVYWLPAAVLAAALLFLLRRFRVARSDRQGRRRKVGRSAAVLAIVSLLVLAISAALLSRVSEESREPFALAEGISLWPTEILRLLAAFLALYFLLRGEKVLRWSCLKLKDEYPGLQHPNLAEPGWGSGVVERLRWILINDWRSALEQDRVDVQKLWTAYLRRSKLGPRLLRVGLLSAGYLLFAISLFLALGFPATPYRGGASFAADKLALGLSILSFIFLTFFVVDVSMQTERMIRRLGSCRSRWPDETTREYSPAPRSEGRPEGAPDGEPACGDSIHEWLDIRFVADRTEHLGSLIMGPFIVLFLMIVSRVSFFDRWDWPLALLLVLGLNSVWVLASAFLLRRAAERARTQSLERLHKDRVRSLCHEPEGATRSVEKLIEEIREIRRGAFAPISEQPAVRAFLVPFGGIGAAMFLEWLATSF